MKNIQYFNLGHYFIKLLDEQGKLCKYFTQNVDGLDRLVGFQVPILSLSNYSLSLLIFNSHAIIVENYLKGIDIY